VAVAVSQLESFAATRVRKNGQCTAPLRETSSPPCSGMRPLALWTRICTVTAFLFNATHDPVENRWKALENYEMLGGIKFIEGLYYHELARALRRVWLRDRQQASGGF